MDGELVCPKMVLASPIAAYENTVEVSDIDELEEIISDPDGMRMQALLVRERILGPAHPDTSYYIRYRGAVYADMGHFERCITLWMYALDMQQKMLEPLSPMTQSSLLSFADVPTRLIRLKEVCKVLGGWMGKTLHCPLITSSTILAAVITISSISICVIINVVSNKQFLQKLISLYTH